MTNPITPPPELVQQWWATETYDPFGVALLNLATKAAQWGADQELEACVAWLDDTDCEDPQEASLRLRWHRRPKPPNLKAQALAALSRADKDALTNPLTGEVVALRTILSKEQSNTIRRALKQLND